MTYDWGRSSEAATIYTVPKGYRLVLTDISGYWWKSGPAQRFLIYQDDRLQGSFLAPSRGNSVTSTSGGGGFGFHSQRSGMVFAPNSKVRAVPSQKNLSVTMCGILETL